MNFVNTKPVRSLEFLFGFKSFNIIVKDVPNSLFVNANLFCDTGECLFEAGLLNPLYQSFGN